ncbi:hypothetical protein TNCV_2431791 [Trichonephila clavipes]|nr:hypothetical protein TNCV_2431791 [Trichonephila clavipes]
MLYHRMVLEPHTAYPDRLEPVTFLLTVQKTVFEPPELTTPKILLPDPPPELTTSQNFYQIHHLSRQHLRSFYQIHLWSRQHSQILFPDPPSKQTTPQILLPDPPVVETTFSDPFPRSTIYADNTSDPLPDPPVVETLEPTLTDDSSMDQIMSSVIGDYLQQRDSLGSFPRTSGAGHGAFACLTRVMISSRSWTILKQGLAIEQQEAPMDLTMPRMKRKSEKGYWV